MLGNFILLVLATLAMAGVPNVDEKRLHDHLSDAEHHDAQYDHEAFLGKDQAKNFDQLPPEESRRRLGIIFDKIDTNNDGFVNLVELKDWIRYTQLRYIDDEVARQWKQHNPNDDDTISWEAYRQSVYGFMKDMDEKDLETEGTEEFSYKNMLKRDRRRWHHADLNDDDQMNRTEFKAFLHPEEDKKMRDVIVIETIEDIDTDKDGKISLSEYIGDMYRAESEGEEEPEWVKNEREQFAAYRDTNSDGIMDHNEVKAWISPADFDHAEAEARHLVFEADADVDERLNKDEVLNKYDLFVGSQATDFGEALVRHDEF